MSSFNLLGDAFLLILYLLIAFSAILGNLFVIHVIGKTPKLRTSNTYVILSNMAISDILGGLSILLQFGLCSHQFVNLFPDEQPSLRACGFSKSLQILSYFISTYSMMFIAINRYRQLKYTSEKKYLESKWAIALSWLIGCLFVSTTFVNMRVSYYFESKFELISCKVAFQTNYDPKTEFRIRQIRIVLLILTQYLIPLIITGFFYLLIWRIIKQNPKQALSELNQKQIMYQMNSKKRTITMLITIVLAFAISWAPLHFIHFFNFFIFQLTSTTCNSSTVYKFAYFFAISSCCFNPLIYYWSNSIFRDELTNLLIKLRLIKNKPEQDNTMVRYSNTSLTNIEDA